MFVQKYKQDVKFSLLCKSTFGCGTIYIVEVSLQKLYNYRRSLFTYLFVLIYMLIMQSINTAV